MRGKQLGLTTKPRLLMPHLGASRAQPRARTSKWSHTIQYRPGSKQRGNPRKNTQIILMATKVGITEVHRLLGPRQVIHLGRNRDTRTQRHTHLGQLAALGRGRGMKKEVGS